MKTRWQVARLRLLGANWSISDCKALRDHGSEKFRSATASLNISLDVVLEIPGVIDEYKEVYCKELIAEHGPRIAEEIRREDALRGLAALAGADTAAQ